MFPSGRPTRACLPSGRRKNINDLLLIDSLAGSIYNRERFDLWREAGLDCVHVTLAVWENARETLSVIGQWNRLFNDNLDLIALARTGEDIEAIRASGRTAVVFGFQNAAPLEDEIDLVQIYHTLGVRIIQLTYNIQNLVASGCWEDQDHGISQFYGRNVIKEMNDVGMLIDISHCGDKTGWDAVKYSERPIAITHGNPAEFVGQDIELKYRNRETDLIKEIADGGGMIGLSPYPKIMRGGPNSTMEGYCEMAEWSAEKFGIDAIGIGSDWNSGHPPDKIIWWRAGRWGRESPVKGKLAVWPDWFKSPAKFPELIEGLRNRFSEEDVRKIAGENWLRLFRESFVPAKS